MLIWGKGEKSDFLISNFRHKITGKNRTQKLPQSIDRAWNSVQTALSWASLAFVVLAETTDELFSEATAEQCALMSDSSI